MSLREARPLKTTDKKNVSGVAEEKPHEVIRSEDQMPRVPSRRGSPETTCPQSTRRKQTKCSREKAEVVAKHEKAEPH